MKQALRYNNKVVKKIYQGTELVKKIDKVSVNRYSKQYLTIESTSDNNTISWRSSASSLLTTISASTDNGVTWTEYTAKVGGTALATLNTGDKLLVKGENSCYSNSWIGWRGGDNRFSSTNAFEVKGNIMSLVSGDSFANADELTASYTFHGLFLGCTHLTSAENLILPATTLSESCYQSMFNGCTSLTTAPVLSATTLEESCYRYMFRNCTSLTTAPQLPAMNLAESCYFRMFYGCSNLTKAPELPATTLVINCYGGMFVNCRKLNYIKCLATDISARECTYIWVNGVSSTGTFVKNAAMNDWSTGGDSGIPSGWTVENTTPSKKSTDVFQYIKNDGDTPTPPTPSYEEQYLTIESTSNNNTIYWKKRASKAQGKTISASTDNGSTWTEYTSASGNGITIATLNSGDTIIFKGENATYFESWNPQGIFASTSSFIVYGNIMSLVYGDNFSGQTTLTSGNTFNGLFSQCSGLTSAENLILPATTLVSSCYSSMFSDCTSLTVAPELPATTLANYCYANMFNGCTSLTVAPELPATTLANSCYSQMFLGCTSLTVAPELPATTLAESCYSQMFQGCTSLTTAPELPSTTLAQSCYSGMFYGCTSLTVAPELPATTLAESCYSYMFQVCTNLTTAPELPVTTLAEDCYSNMFNGCTSLTVAPELPATTLTDFCYAEMFFGCDTLNYIKCLATDISARECTYNWVNGVASTGTFVKKASMTRWTTDSNGIPEGWTVVDA